MTVVYMKTICQVDISTSELDAEKEPIQVQLVELDDAYCITQA